ncbi:MAG TPA: acetamidase/formamidase family protein [Gaiellaceae bacterium]|nr:acetamidase/formamidase family protein [Gaiellaceae bacterium]
MALHEIPLERRTLHGHFAQDLEPILTVDPGDSIAFATLDAGWGLEPPDADGQVRSRFEPRDDELDSGHALIGPVEVRGARVGQTLSVRIDEVRVGPYGFTFAGGFSTPLNDRLGVSEGDTCLLVWELDADRGVGRDRDGRELDLRPFLGVMGMPPPEPGHHSTAPPRICGGNLDCTELVAGTTLYLPIPVDGALFSAGDCHARQGDGEVSQLAIECPAERVVLTLDLRDAPEPVQPYAWTPAAWIVFGFDEDLDEAAALALDNMLGLMGREYGFERRDALALASAVVDLRVTQVVNGVRGVHAVLRHDALRPRE